MRSSNICRFIPSFPGYIYAVDQNDVFVNLFMSNQSNIKVNGKTMSLTQSTQYPWNGDIKIEVAPQGRQQMNLKIRIPGWVTGNVVPSDLYSYGDKKKLNYAILVNGQKVDSKLTNGYFDINRQWRKGDVVQIHFDMEPRTV